MKISLFMSCDLFIIFIMIDFIISRIDTLAYFLEYDLLFLDDNMDDECENFLNSLKIHSSVSRCCLAFA